ncbi:hypothetical protein KI688_008572 [Linnemannia hyalina]|uniref:GH16 domain-containing protein n=1 Tax=Linnemannia hyalina TaxID=64524 RepID=A0A9P7Y0K4_9FUNG|nr:hypothetical protein KI688_008572 [Linnemannia hyalina]
MRVFHRDTVIGHANFSGNPLDAAWTSDFQPNNARIEKGNLILKLQKGNTINKFGNKPGFGATVSSTRWMLYGTVSARIKSGSLSGGIISSFIFRSSLTGDEIDYEWVGRDPTEVQSNYYWRTPANMDPKDIDYSHSDRKDIGIHPAQEYQTYTIEWLPNSLTWFINGKVIRTLLRSEVNGTKYPNTPSQIQFSIWDGGLSDPETREWAGGPTVWEEGQPAYEMMVDWVDVKCHSPVDPNAWPPKDKGYQNFVNPLAKDTSSPLAKEAIVLGDNAPKFSTLENGGLHWGRFNGGGGKSLVGNRSPLPKWNQGVSRFGSRSGSSLAWISLVSVFSVFVLHVLSL